MPSRSSGNSRARGLAALKKEWDKAKVKSHYLSDAQAREIVDAWGARIEADPERYVSWVTQHSDNVILTRGSHRYVLGFDLEGLYIHYEVNTHSERGDDTSMLYYEFQPEVQEYLSQFYQPNGDKSSYMVGPICLDGDIERTNYNKLAGLSANLMELNFNWRMKKLLDEDFYWYYDDYETYRRRI